MEELEVEPVSPKSQVQEVGVLVLESVKVAVSPATEEVKLATGAGVMVTEEVVLVLLPLAFLATKVTV